MPPSSAAPQSIGRYVMYEEIASGGMASVHFGRLLGPAGFARPVAIKRLHPQYARDYEFVKMFLDEARLASRIHHPNVVSTLDVLTVEDEIFLVMDYVPGETLSQLARVVRLRNERIAPRIAAGVVSGMLHGLHAAHEAKDDQGGFLELVHRDVSPQNALVGGDGVTRLIDFGVAKATGRLQSTRDGQLKGKLAYMAPEQLTGEAITRRTDVYSAAVILWEALTSQRLFEADNEANLLLKILAGDVPPPSSVQNDLPRSLDRVVARGLDRDPAKRYASAREMAAHVEACVGVASPSEIADWLERTVGEVLRERAARIDTIERAGAAAVAKLPPSEPPDEPSSADLPTVVGSRAARARRNLRLGLFLRAADNEYQHLQREECLRVARRCGFSVAEAIGNNDADVQRRQIEDALAEPDAVRPHVFLVNPVDEAALRATALLAARKGVGWVSLNRNGEYLDELRLDYPNVLLFSVTPDQRQVGRIQGRQLRILLPGGGEALYVSGPVGTSSARLRRSATEEEIAGCGIQLIVESSDWTVEGGAQVAAKWLARAHGEPDAERHIACAQNDGMAIGALSSWIERQSGAGTPGVRAIGCDGTPSYGRRLVEEGQLVATVIIPPTTGRAVEEIALSFERGVAPPAAVGISVDSFPPIRSLRRAAGEITSTTGPRPGGEARR